VARTGLEETLDGFIVPMCMHAWVDFVQLVKNIIIIVILMSCTSADPRWSYVNRSQPSTWSRSSRRSMSSTFHYMCYIYVLYLLGIIIIVQVKANALGSRSTVAPEKLLGCFSRRLDLPFFLFPLPLLGLRHDAPHTS
jgi:hypothetical protein